MTARLKADLDDPVVRHVRSTFASISEDSSVAEALAHLRGTQLPEQIVYFYVVDGEQRLTGVIPTRRMLMSALDTRIGDICVRKVVAIPEAATVLDACEFFIQHRFLAFPVIDRERRIKGIVDVGLFTDELLHLHEKASADEIFQLIGVHAGRGRKQSPWAGFATRFPWLISNIAAGVLCAFIASRYEDILGHFLVLALFIPVVLALSESVSIQSMTITLQGLHGERVQIGKMLKGLGREFLVAALLGLASGGVVAGVAWAWQGEPHVAGVIGLSIMLAMITACLLGVLLPTLVRLFGRDPRIASGPIVLAIGDLATLLFYFNLAGLLLSRH